MDAKAEENEDAENRAVDVIEMYRKMVALMKQGESVLKGEIYFLIFLSEFSH